MIRVWLLVMGLLFCPPLLHAADPTPAADAAWVEIVKNSKPPVPPAEWNQKPPTQEEMTVFKRKAGDAADQLADQTKKFYESYPDHPKSNEAREKEKTFRKLAASLRAVKEETQAKADAAVPSQNPDDKLDPAFKAKYLDAVSRIRAARQSGPPAVLAEIEKSGRDLTREFPNQSEAWEMLVVVAQNAEPSKALSLYKDIAANAPDAAMKEAAQDQFKTLDRLNKPLALTYKATDGRDVDISKLKGKVVLVDFWATWCGPCIAELPNVKKAYEELHPEGFEILGVSFDEDCDDLKKFVAKNKMEWPQFCDGGGWNNAVNKEFGIHGIPAMYLLDKKGVLRDLNARENLVDKIRALLKE